MAAWRQTATGCCWSCSSARACGGPQCSHVTDVVVVPGRVVPLQLCCWADHGSGCSTLTATRRPLSRWVGPHSPGLDALQFPGVVPRAVVVPGLVQRQPTDGAVPHVRPGVVVPHSIRHVWAPIQGGVDEDGVEPGWSCTRWVGQSCGLLSADSRVSLCWCTQQSKPYLRIADPEVRLGQVLQLKQCLRAAARERPQLLAPSFNLCLLTATAHWCELLACCCRPAPREQQQQPKGPRGVSFCGAGECFICFGHFCYNFCTRSSVFWYNDAACCECLTLNCCLRAWNTEGTRAGATSGC